MQTGVSCRRNTSKQRDTNSILLSIVTVVRNAENLLNRTIQSIRNQDYPNIEYIVIDGASSDRTLDIIKQNEDIIDYWVSASDKGIYDAMNKGISLATGYWVNFMNAGDEFFDNKTCSNVVEQIVKNGRKIYYGDILARDSINQTEVFVKARPLNQIWRGLVFSHQSVFVGLNELKTIPFNLKFKIAADYNQILTFYNLKIDFYYMPIIVAKVEIGGLSYSSSKTVLEQMRIVRNFRPYSINMFYFLSLLGLSIIRKILGQKLTSKMRRLKWRFIH